MGEYDLDIPSISESSTRSPVELERTRGIRNHGSVKRKRFSSSSWRGEIDKAVSSIATFYQLRFSFQIVVCTDPENLSLIILTLTCSPIPNQTLRMKFSSIQGSSSPILSIVSPSPCIRQGNAPESCLSIAGSTATRSLNTTLLSKGGRGTTFLAGLSLETLRGLLVCGHTALGHVAVAVLGRELALLTRIENERHFD